MSTDMTLSSKKQVDTKYIDYWQLGEGLYYFVNDTVRLSVY